MIVTCPSCDTRYNLSDEQLGATGRTIQCVKCQYSWFQTPSELPSKKEVGGEEVTAKAPIAPENTSAETIPSAQKKADAPKKIVMALPQPVIIGGSVLLLAFIALLVTLLITNPFAPNLPPGYRAMDTFEGERNMDSAPMDGFILTHVDRKIVQDGDITILIFTGKVTNTGSVVLDIPEIRVQLLDKRGVELDFWPAQVDVSALEAGASADWSARFLSPDLTRISEYRAFFYGGE